MNLRLRSLLMRLTIAYSVAILCIIVLFTVGSTLLVRGLTANLIAAMNLAEKQIDPLLVSLHADQSNLHTLAPVIEKRLSIPGVLVLVFPHHPHMGFHPPEAHFGRSLSFGEGGPPNGPDPFAEGLQHRNDIRRNADIGMSLLLNVLPKRYRVNGGEIILLPLPTSIGTSYYLFIAEMLTLGILLILAAGVVGRTLTLRGFAPLREVSTALAQLADGEFSSAPVRVSDEIEMSDLAINYNRAVLRVTSAIAERERNERRMRQFIADASHELRTPLTVILGYFDALSKPSDNHAQQFEKAYPIISAEGQRMRVLIDNMSLLTKLDQQHVARIEIVDLSELACEIVLALSIFAENDRFVMHIDPSVLITGNREELFAAIRNLVENALKYAPEGQITLRSAYEAQHAVFEISDQGPGIAEEDLPHLFTRFYRGEQRGNVSGSGLGLPIVSRAVERAGGTITLQGLVPNGTRFRLEFPRRDFQ